VDKFQLALAQAGSRAPHQRIPSGESFVATDSTRPALWGASR